MRAGDPRRWRLGGWRGRGRQRAGWWKGSDGRWYPPEAAWHPAARDEPAAPRHSVPRRLAFAGSLWLVAAVPVALLLVVLVAGLADTSPTDRVETFGAEDAGPADGDDPPSGAVAASVSASAGSEAVQAAAIPTTAGGSHAAEPTDPVGPPTTGEPAPDAPDDDRDGDRDRDDDRHQEPDSDRAGPPVSSSPPPSSPVPPTPPPTSVPPPPTSAPPTARPPGSAADCRDGGWRHLTDHEGRPFPNQGQCVSYANARG